MKNLSRLIPGSYLILSDPEMENVAGGFNVNDWCNPRGETCNGSCIGTLGGGQSAPIINGTCQMVYGQWHSACTCVGEQGAG